MHEVGLHLLLLQVGVDKDCVALRAYQFALYKLAERLCILGSHGMRNPALQWCWVDMLSIKALQGTQWTYLHMLACLIRLRRHKPVHHAQEALLRDGVEAGHDVNLGEVKRFVTQVLLLKPTFEGFELWEHVIHGE